MTRVLVTGFEAFEGGTVNPSQRLVEALAADPPQHVELYAARSCGSSATRTSR